ncbi:Uncharacterised protein [Mycobacteroides abscessus subsp. abscessus]|nr:Uncharacterised protein [Mycobacteroides abscessus subsp. abscessus]SHY08760.1 Uncharacterised protein [Mycobacteroides abscessus subsp. abscessus]
MAECPTRASGISVATDPSTSSGVHDQRSTTRLVIATPAAMKAIQRQAFTVSISLANVHSSPGPKSLSG